MIDERELGFKLTWSNYIFVRPYYSWGPREVLNPELIYIVSGNFEYETASGVVELNPDQILYIPVNCLHTLRNKADEGCISCIHFNPIYGEHGFEYIMNNLKTQPLTVVNAGAGRTYHDLFARCADEVNRLSPYRDALLTTMFRELWLRLCELWRQPLNDTLSRRMQKMTAYLNKHFAENITRSTLARKFGLTPEHVNALFRKELGITPTRYIHYCRVYKAYSLIFDNGFSVKEAAEAVGFYDQFYFSRIFKRVTGRSPSELRK